MATVTRPSKSLPDPGDALDAEPIRDYITNILSFLESTNIDEGNVDLTGSDGILGKSTAQTATGLKTWGQTTAASASVIDVAIFQWNPSSGTTSDNQGMRLSFKMDDDAGNLDEVGTIDLVETDVSSTTEDAEWQLHAVAAGSLTKSLTVGGTGTTSHLPLTVGVNDTGHDVKFFGASSGAYMEWDESADQLRIMGASADATTSTGKLLLATSLTDINANDVLGKIDFQAPHEAGGTDAITVAASIQAIAQGTFAADLNATDLIFYTGHSEAATEKIRITSQGEIGIGGANYGSDGQVLTSGGAGAAPAWETPTTGDITGVTAGVGLSGGGSSGGVTLTLDLSELSAVTPVSGDWFATLDSDGANEQLTTTDALATLFAGTGLTASSAVIGVDASQTQITAVGTITTGTWSGVIDGSCTMTLGSDATGDIYYRDASGHLERLASGADGYVLTGTGAGSIPAWEAATAGDITGVTAGTGLSGGGTSGGVTLNVDAAQTGITSLLATDIKIGEDDETKIDFETADEIHFFAADTEQVYLADNIFGPQSDSDVDLGTTGVRWKDAFVDSITVTGEVDGASLDISGNADIDGTTNLDAVDIDGAVQIDATVSVGVDDQGYDVKFFGDTASAYLLWDTSADKLLTAGGASVDIVKDKLLIGGTAVTTTAAELNVLDAVTAGTVSASLGVVVDSNKDIGSFRNITLTGELDAGSLDVSGDANIAGEVQTAGIGYTDGDNAITIADGGGITAAAGITSTAASNSFGATSFGDANITNVGDIALDTISSDAGTSIGITLGTDAGDDLLVSTNKLVVEGDTGRVGIGTAAPSVQFHVSDGGTAPSYAANTIGAIQNNSADSDIARFAIIGGAATGYSVLDFGDVNASNAGGLTYNHATNALAIATGGSGTTAMTIDSSQQVSIGPTASVTGSVAAITSSSSASLSFESTHANAAARNWAFRGADAAHGDLSLLQSTTKGGDAIGGNVIMNFSAGGNVGIGTNNPTQLVTIAEDSASDIGLFITNTTASSGAGARVGIFATGSGGGDPYIQFGTDATNWYTGVDNSDSDRFYIADSAAGTDFNITTGGIVSASGKVVGGAATPLFTDSPTISAHEFHASMGSNNNTFTVFDTRTTAQDVGAGVNFGGYNTAQSSVSTFARISGFKQNGTGGNHSGYLAFGTNANGGAGSIVEAMRINSGGQVLIGATAIADPYGAVQIAHSSSGATAHADADELFLESSGNTGITIASSTSGTGNILFGDSGDNDIGRIQYHHSSNQVGIVAGATGTTFFNSGPMVGIGESGTNGNMTIGLTIDQGANDNEILALKSSDMNHGVTGAAETDTYLSVKKHDAASGGARLQAFTESDDALVLFSCHLSDNTTKSTGATASIVNDVYKGDGTNTGTPGANSNLMAIRNGGVGVRFIFDADGDSHQDVGTAWTNFDGEEDAQVCRSVAHVMTELAETSKGGVGAGVMVKSKFDQWGIDHKESLIHMGLIPRLTPEEEVAGDRPLMNMTQLARVHNGAIWQTHIEIQQMKEDFAAQIDQRDTKIALLEQRLNRLES